MNIFSKVIEILFPTRCFLCKKTGAALCDGCIGTLPTAAAVPNKHIYAALEYSSTRVRTLLWDFKFSNRRDLALPLTQILHESLLETLAHLETFEGFSKPLIVPIPMSRREKRKRGYNQAELLGSQLTKLLHTEGAEYTPGALEKIRDTKQQSKTSNRAERLHNIRDCFTASGIVNIRDRNIIIVDDIVTTGATLKEAMKTLKKAGARRVIGVAVAH